MNAPVLIERRGPVEIVTLNRPEVLNALDEALVISLKGYFQELPDRQDVRVVVLRGAGRAFCAGLDLKAWKNTGQKGGVHHGWHTQRGITGVLQLTGSRS